MAKLTIAEKLDNFADAILAKKGIQPKVKKALRTRLKNLARELKKETERRDEDWARLTKV